MIICNYLEFKFLVSHPTLNLVSLSSHLAVCIVCDFLKKNNEIYYLVIKKKGEDSILVEGSIYLETMRWLQVLCLRDWTRGFT